MYDCNVENEVITTHHNSCGFIIAKISTNLPHRKYSALSGVVANCLRFSSLNTEAKTQKLNYQYN